MRTRGISFLRAFLGRIFQNTLTNILLSHVGALNQFDIQTPLPIRLSFTIVATLHCLVNFVPHHSMWLIHFLLLYFPTQTHPSLGRLDLHYYSTSRLQSRPLVPIPSEIRLLPRKIRLCLMNCIFRFAVKGKCRLILARNRS